MAIRSRGISCTIVIMPLKGPVLGAVPRQNVLSTQSKNDCREDPDRENFRWELAVPYGVQSVPSTPSLSA